MKKCRAYLRSICLLIFFSTSFTSTFFRLNAERYSQEECSCILQNTMNSGMFSIFGAVIETLDLYDQGRIPGLKIDLNNGIYLDPSVGPNWWEYFCEPINLGNQNLASYIYSFNETWNLALSGLGKPKHRAHELIRKYIFIKPSIQKEIDFFVRKNFKSRYVIGVHYRGTDKITEWALVPYEKTVQTLKEQIAKLTPAQKLRLKVYVATDDQKFLNYLLDHIPHGVVIYNDFSRSTDDTPLHYNDKFYSSNYQKGKEALLDCILLSKCDFLIRPASSCLSLMSMNFNPDMPVISLW